MRFSTIIVILCLSAGMFILAYSLGAGSMKVVEKVANATMDSNPLENDIFEGFFSINRVRYHEEFIFEESNESQDIGMDDNQTEDCSEERIILIDILLENSKLPDACEVFIDKRFATSIDVSEPICYPECKGEEAVFTISARRHPISEDHNIEVCCDGICHNEKLVRICTN